MTWHPDFSGKPGSHFYVKYRKVGETNYNKTDFELYEDYIQISVLDPNVHYEFVVVSVEDNYEAPSIVQTFDTHVYNKIA